MGVVSGAVPFARVQKRSVMETGRLPVLYAQTELQIRCVRTAPHQAVGQRTVPKPTRKKFKKTLGGAIQSVEWETESRAGGRGAARSAPQAGSASSSNPPLL